MVADLPALHIVNKDVSLEYKMENGLAEITADFSGDMFEGKIEHDGVTYRVSATTPFSGLENISSRVTYKSTPEKTSVDVFLEINGKVNTFIGYYSHVSYDVFFDLKTSFKKIQKMKVELRNIGNQFEATFAVNNMFFQTHMNLDFVNTKFDIFWKNPRNDLVFRFGHSWSDQSRDVNMTVNYNTQVGNIRIISENSKIFVETTSPYYQKKLLKLSWQKGAYELHIEHHKTEIISSKVEYAIGYWMGKINFLMRLNYEDFDNLHIETDYNLDGASKSLDLRVDYGTKFFDMDSDCNMTHDTFQGINRWKSSIDRWENAIFEGSYDIKEKTELQFSIEKEGKRDVINVIIKIDSYIPKVYIRTPFKGYEKVKFSGKYNLTNMNGNIGFKIEANGVSIIQLTNKLTMSEDQKNFELAALFKAVGRKDVNIDFEYELGIPYKATLTVQSDGQVYSMAGKLSLDDLAFSIDVKSPIKDFEEFNFAGQFGTTSMKTIYSFNQGRSKRHISFEYDIDKNGANVEIQTPLESMKRIQFKAGVMGDKGFTFSFDSEGHHDFSFGLKYDLQAYQTSGDLLAVFKCPHINADYKVIVGYNNLDGSFENGINAKFSFFESGDIKFAGKIARTPGKTVIEIKTPFEGWKEVNLHMFSDWKTKVDIIFKRDSRLTKIHLEQHGLYDYNIYTETPYEGYEKIVMTSKKTDDTIVIQIKKHEELISEISVKAIIGDIGKAIGSLEVKWDASDNIFVYINGSFDGIKAILSINTSFPKVKTILLEVGVQKNGFERKTKIIGKLNDYFIMYESLSSWTDVEIKSNSLTTTNIEALGFKKSETELSILYSENLTKPFELKSETKTDGVVTFDVISTLKLDFRGGEVKLVYSGDFPAKNGKIDALLHVMSDLQTRLEINGKWSINSFNVKMLLGGKNADAKLESNFDKLENLKGKAVWTIAKGMTKQYGVEVDFQQCNDKVCDSALNFNILFDTKPFKHFQASVVAPEYLNEAFNMTFGRIGSKYSIVAEYSGIKEFHVNATADIPKRAVDITIHNKSDGRKWKLITNAEFEMNKNKSVVVNVQLIVRTPFTEDFTAIVIVDFISRMKQFELTFQYGVIDVSLKTNIMWSKEASELLLRVSCPAMGFQKMYFEGKRESFRKMHYTFEFNEKRWEFSNYNSIGNGNFDVSMKILLPITGYETITFHAAGQTDPDNRQTGTAELNIAGKAISGTFTRNQLNFIAEVKSQLYIARHIVIATNIIKCEKYNLEVTWNESKIKLNHMIDCETYKSRINYESDFEILKKLNIEFIPKGNGDFGVELGFSGMGLNLSLTGDAKSLATGKHFMWNVVSNEKEFKSDMSYSLEKGWKSVNMTYRWGSDRRIEINAILNTQDMEMAHFVLEFTSPFRDMKSVVFEASMNNIASAIEGKMKVEFNEHVIDVQLGSNGDNLYLEVETPITSFEKLKVSINHQGGNMKSTVSFGANKLEANFIRKSTVYNFDISTNIDGKKYRFYGKIDVVRKALQTAVRWKGQKIRMKANSNGKSMSVSLTSQIENFRNIKIKGDWEWIKDGFTLKAVGNLDANHTKSLNNLFHAQFTSTEKQTTGFWKVRSGIDEIRFNLNVDKAPNEMDVKVSIDLPDMETLQCQVRYFLEENTLGGTIILQTPWKKMKIEFKAGYKSAREFEFLTRLECPEEIFDFDATMKLTAIDDIEFKIKCKVPALKKSLGAEFVFKPRSLNDFQFFVTLILDQQKFGGGAAFKFDGRKVDAQISVYTPIINGDYKMGGEFSSTPSSGLLSLYFNRASWNVEFNVDSGNFSAKSKFNLSQFIQSLLGSFADLDLPIIKEIEFEVDYKYMESATIFAEIEDRGKVGFSLSVLGKRILGNLELNIVHLNIAKAAHFAFEYSRNGQLEISVQDNGDRIDLEVVGDDPGAYKPRKVRAAVYSSAFGNSEFEFDKAKNKGVFVLTTKSGKHKVSYDIRKVGGYDVTINMESPYLNNGYASTTFSIDTTNKVYECRLSLNNDHFLSAFLNMKNSGVETGFDLESTLLPEKVGLKARYNWDGKEFLSNIAITYKSKHSCSIHFDVSKYSVSASLSSVFVPFKMLALEAEWQKSSETDEITLILKYGEETIQIGTALTSTSFSNFSGSITFVSSEYILLKSCLQYEFKFQEEKKVKLELTTSSPKLSKLYWETSLDDSSSFYIVKTTVKLPLNGYERYDVSVKTEKEGIADMLSKQVEISITTPAGTYFILQSWSLEETNFLAQIKVDCPYGVRYHFVSSAEWVSNVKIFASMNMPFIDKVELSLFSAEPWDLLKNTVNMVIDVYGNVMTANIKYDFISGVEIICDSKTSFPRFNYQRLAFGFENSDRKMLKAHINVLGEENGIELDYKFTEITNCVALIKLDFPFHDWTDMYLDVGSQMGSDIINIRAGAGIDKLKIGGNFLKLSKKIITDFIFNDNFINIIYEDDSSKSIRIEAETFLVNTSVKMISMSHANRHLLSEFQMDVNEQKKIHLYQNSLMKITSLMVQDVIFPFYVNIAVYFDQYKDLSLSDSLLETMGISSMFSWDTARFLQNSVLVNFTIRKCENCGDFSLVSRLPGRIPVSVRASVASSPTTTSNSVDIFLGTEKDSSYERILSQHTFFQTSETEYEKRHVVKFKSYVFEFDTHSSNNQGTQAESVNVKWGTAGKSLKGVGYLLKKEENEDHSETRLVLSHPIDSWEDNILAFILQKKDGKTVLDIKADHPNKSKQFSLKGISMLSNTLQNLNTKTLVGYTMGGSSFRYVDAEINVDKTTRTCTAVINSNKETVEIQGKWKSRNKVHSSELVVHYNHLRYLYLTSELNSHIPALQSHLLLKDVADIKMFAGLETDSDAIFKITHTSVGAEVEDMKLHCDLKNGNTITYDAKWRHGAVTDIQSFIKNVAITIESATSDQHWVDMENALDILHENTNEVSKDIIYLSNIDIKLVFLQIKRATLFAKELSKDHEKVIIDLVDYYATSIDTFADFGIEFAVEVQKIPQYFALVFQQLSDDMFVRIKNNIGNLKTRSTNMKKHVILYLKNMDIRFKILGRMATDMIFQIKGFIDLVAEKYRKLVADYKARSAIFREKFISTIKGEIMEFIGKTITFLDQFEIVHKIVHVYKLLEEWVEDNNILKKIEDTYLEIKGYLEENFIYFDQFKEKAEKLILKTRLFLMDKYTQLKEYPLVSYTLSVTKGWVSFAKDLLASQLKNYNIRSLAELLLARLDIYTSTAIKVIDFLYNNNNLISYEFVFEPQSGYLLYSQILPIHWVRFSETPAFLNLFGPSTQPAPVDITLFYFQMHDFFRSFFTAISTKTLLPPFAAVGMMIGDNQIMTFDRGFYDFSGNCSYLLTSDFNHDRFSVVGNYENQVRKSISINLEGKVIKINKDGKVLLNNNMIDLPVILDDTFLKREGHKITLLNKKGLKVICNLIHNVCTFKVSGWYFGKTGGLLGVYDNEPSNDRMTSGRVIVDDLKTFTDSWQITNNCASNYEEIELDETEWDKQKCSDYFEKTSSPMVPCFDTVDPKPFLVMCTKQMEYMKKNPTETKGFCQVASSYIELCKVNNLEMWIPGECFSCEAPGKPVIRGGGFTDYYDNSAPRSADVTFVVQQGKCLNNLKFKTILQLVEASFKENKVRNNQYAVVGYGGPEELMDPHIYTAASKIFNNHDTILQAFEGLSSTGEGGDVYDAMAFAARMTTRPAVAKVMVVLTCTQITNGYFYGDAITMLREELIKMHYINPTQLNLKNKKSRNTILGFDKFSVFTAKNLNTLSGDVTLRGQLKVPKDYLSTLATESGGSVFSQSSFVQSARNFKTAASIFGRRVARTAVPSDCQICECISDREGEGRIACYECIVDQFDLVRYNWNKYSELSG
eukprot:GFUD01023385.1.p1 GENE.GFUD01023385.1~~GFUD01023385.1.p1  ORF type:complete len:4113 (+),score=926.88 GFUD01023385.1:759-12341(+)